MPCPNPVQLAAPTAQSALPSPSTAQHCNLAGGHANGYDFSLDNAAIQTGPPHVIVQHTVERCSLQGRGMFSAGSPMVNDNCKSRHGSAPERVAVPFQPGRQEETNQLDMHPPLQVSSILEDAILLSSQNRQ